MGRSSTPRFGAASDRAAFHGACRRPVVFVQCMAPDTVIRARALRRAVDPERISDATAAIAADQQREFEPLDEVAARAHIVLRTDRPTEEVLEELESALDERLQDGDQAGATPRVWRAVADSRYQRCARSQPGRRLQSSPRARC